MPNPTKAIIKLQQNTQRLFSNIKAVVKGDSKSAKSNKVGNPEEFTGFNENSSILLGDGTLDPNVAKAITDMESMSKADRLDYIINTSPMTAEQGYMVNKILSNGPEFTKKVRAVYGVNQKSLSPDEVPTAANTRIADELSDEQFNKSLSEIRGGVAKGKEISAGMKRNVERLDSQTNDQLRTIINAAGKLENITEEQKSITAAANFLMESRDKQTAKNIADNPIIGNVINEAGDLVDKTGKVVKKNAKPQEDILSQSDLDDLLGDLVPVKAKQTIKERLAAKLKDKQAELDAGNVDKGLLTQEDIPTKKNSPPKQEAVTPTTLRDAERGQLVVDGDTTPDFKGFKNYRVKLGDRDKTITTFKTDGNNTIVDDIRTDSSGKGISSTFLSRSLGATGSIPNKTFTFTTITNPETLAQLEKGVEPSETLLGRLGIRTMEKVDREVKSVKMVEGRGGRITMEFELE